MKSVGLLAMPQFPVQVLKAVVGVKKKRTKEAFAASHERVKSQSVTEEALKGQKEEMKRVLSCEG